MWLRKDRAGFFFKKKLDQPSSHFPETSSALCACKASQGLMKCFLNPVPRLLHALQFFLFSFSSGVHQYHSNVCLIRPTKTNGDNGRSKTNDWQKAVRCCPEQLSSHYRWDVHNKAQPWNADREQSLLPPAAGKKNKDGWIFDAWFVNDAEATIKYVFHSLTDRKFTGAPASDSAPRVTRCVSSQDRCVTSLGNNRSVTAACDSTVLAVLWAVSHICHSRKSTGAKKKITFMMVEFHSVALVFSLLLVMVTHCHLFMVYWDTWIERGHRYRH